MNIIKAYGRGFKNSLRRPKMIFLIYVISLVLGLSLALPFFFSFQSAAGNSIISKNIDYTTFNELMNFHAWNLDSIFRQAGFTMVVFWLIMIFFVGGIIRSFNKEDYSVSTFFSGAGVNFFRFLVCDIIMIVAQIVTAAVLFFVATFILKLFGDIITQRPLYWAYGIAAFIFGCAIVLLLMISDYAKFYMEMAETHRVFKAIGKATKYVFNNFIKTYFLYALLLVVPIATLILYKFTFDKIGTAATWALIVMFLVQQLFVILRIWFRVWSLSSQFEMYADDYVQVISFDLDVKKVAETTTEVVETVESEDNNQSTNDKEADKIIVVVDPSIQKPETENESVEVVNSDDPVSKVVKTVTETVENPEDDSVTVITTTTTTETFVIDENSEEAKSLNENSVNVEDVEPDDIDVETLTQFYDTDESEQGENAESVSEKSENQEQEDEPDDIDVETLTQFYDNEVSENQEVSSESKEDSQSSDQAEKIEIEVIDKTQDSSDSKVEIEIIDNTQESKNDSAATEKSESSESLVTETTQTVVTETVVTEIVENQEVQVSEASETEQATVSETSDSDQADLDVSETTPGQLVVTVEAAPEEDFENSEDNSDENSEDSSDYSEVSDNSEEELPGFNPDDMDGYDESDGEDSEGEEYSNNSEYHIDSETFANIRNESENILGETEDEYDSENIFDETSDVVSSSENILGESVSNDSNFESAESNQASETETKVIIKTIDGKDVEVSDDQNGELLENDEVVDSENTNESSEMYGIDDIDSDIDTAMGANISLDDDEDDIVSTVTTTTTTTVTTTTVTETTETSESKSEPKIIKIYTEQINSDSPTAETEIVPEYVEDGVETGLVQTEDQFVDSDLEDGFDGDDDSPAFG